MTLLKRIRKWTLANWMYLPLLVAVFTFIMLMERGELIWAIVELAFAALLVWTDVNETEFSSNPFKKTKNKL